jgi:2-phosphosulfolactate phosphatase
MYSIEVCFSPLSWHLFEKPGSVVMITDIFRATTAMCAAFQNKVKSLIPVAEISESIAYKNEGFIVSGERDGAKLECAEFGNSPFNFMEPRLQGKTVVMNTTNGTQAIKKAKDAGNIVCIGAFTNLDAISNWVMQQDRDLIIFCAGWKNRFSLEDSLFAGAVAEYIMTKSEGKFSTQCDSTIAAIDLWLAAKNNPRDYIEKAAHRHRLKKMGLDDILDYSMCLNTNRCVPVLVGDEIVDLNAEKNQ